MAYQIWDLDGTVIDSRHRAVAKPNGDFCLDGWRANCTPELIAKDTVLPMAAKMRANYYRGDYTIICTARQMTQADFDFLDDNQLFADAILFRPNDCNDSDADLKEYMLDEFFTGLGEIGLDSVRAVMYEDNLKVIDRLRTRGVLCLYCGDMENE